MKERTLRLLLTASCVLGAVVTWNTVFLEETELRGGTITGPLIEWNSNGGWLYLLAAACGCLWPRIAAAIALAASVMAAPLYVYFTLPRVFRMLVPGEYHSKWTPPFAWDTPSVVGLFAIGCVLYMAARSRRKRSTSIVSNSEGSQDS